MDCTVEYVPGSPSAPSTSCPAGCSFEAAVDAAAATSETCIDTVEGEVVANCSAGYERGDAQSPSESCPSGCTLTQAVPAMCNGFSDEQGQSCALNNAGTDCAVSSGDCIFEPGTNETCTDTVEGEVVADCTFGYEPGDAENPSETCPTDCTPVSYTHLTLPTKA